jgi:hypothetical protein
MIHQRLQLLPRILTASLLVVLIFCLQMGGAIAQVLPTTSSTPLAKSTLAAPDSTPKSLKTKVLETGARFLQDTTPVNQLEIYLDGFHNYSSEANLPGEQQHQMRVAHYCQELSEDLEQCAVYDGNTRTAHLIGIEHIISDPLYQALPDAEKRYWHPHNGEVASGNLTAPGIPEPALQTLLDKARTTHGKTWHVWDPQQNSLPFGEARLMWAIAPDQVNAATRKQMAAREKSVQF